MSSDAFSDPITSRNTDPVTRAQLRQLRTAERDAAISRLIASYAHAIRVHVLDVARYGNRRYVHFWIVDEVTASAELRHVTGLHYPWHSKYVRPVDDRRKRRPIPEEHLGEILLCVRAQFPDAVIERIKEFLFISW